MLRQVVLSLLVLGTAFVVWALFAPGARETLAGYGITLPFVPAATDDSAAPQPGRSGGGPGAGPGGGGPGGVGGRGGLVGGGGAVCPPHPPRIFL